MLCRFFEDDFQKARCARIARRTQLGHRPDLLLGLARASRKHGAAQSVCARLHHGASGGEVVAEAVVDQVTRPKAHGVHGTGNAPVVGACAFGFVDRARTGKHTAHLCTKTMGAEAAKHVLAAVGFLAL